MRAGEDAPKVLLCEHEDLSTGPQHPVKGKAVHIYNSALWGQRQLGPGASLAGQPSQLVSSRLSKRLCLKTMVENA